MTYKGKKIRLSHAFWQQYFMLEEIVLFSYFLMLIFPIFKKKKCELRILYPAKLTSCKRTQTVIMCKNSQNIISMRWTLTKESTRESALDNQKWLNWHQYKDDEY